MLNELARDLWNVSHHFNLHRDLLKAAPEYLPEINQADFFWGRTIYGLRDLSVLLLCRLYDQSSMSDPLHLHGWLEVVKKNPQLFDDQKFRDRLKGNEHVENLAKSRVFDAKQLDEDLKNTSRDDPIVKRLYKLRCKVYAHKDKDFVVKGRNLLKETNFKYDEIEKLIARAYEIINRYSMLYSAKTWSEQVYGRDDFLRVLKALKATKT